MPTIKVRVTSSTPDALSTLQEFATIGPSVVNMWGAGVTGTDDGQLFIGTRALMNVCDLNIEGSADVIDTDRDQLLVNEVVEAGKLKLAVTVTTECQFLISIRPLGAAA
jgi:hypothetical protein